MKRLIPVLTSIVLALSLQSCAVGRFAVNAQYPVPQHNGETQGVLEEVFFPSSEPGMVERRAYVYLPKDYYDNEDRYPVLYLLHGARGNECSWIEKGNLLHNIDSLCACKAMLPTIVVLPNASQYDDVGDYGKSRLKGALESFYEIDGTVESRFVDDVVSSTDSLYRTIPDKQHRAIAGLSVGAMQSIYISARNPETFAYVGLFSPYVHPFLKRGDDNEFFRKLDENMAIQFQNPPTLYLLMIGKTDIFMPTILCWEKKLTAKGFPHEFHLVPGGHEWNNWEDFSVKFMQRLWK